MYLHAKYRRKVRNADVDSHLNAEESARFWFLRFLNVRLFVNILSKRDKMCVVFYGKSYLPTSVYLIH